MMMTQRVHASTQPPSSLATLTHLSRPGMPPPAHTVHSGHDAMLLQSGLQPPRHCQSPPPHTHTPATHPCCCSSLQSAQVRDAKRHGDDEHATQLGEMQERLAAAQSAGASLRLAQQQLQMDLEAAQLAANQLLAEKASFKVRAGAGCGSCTARAWRHRPAVSRYLRCNCGSRLVCSPRIHGVCCVRAGSQWQAAAGGQAWHEERRLSAVRTHAYTGVHRRTQA
jgi:hypothetical protein